MIVSKILNRSVGENVTVINETWVKVTTTGRTGVRESKHGDNIIKEPKEPYRGPDGRTYQ